MARVGFYWIMEKENITQHFIHGRGVWVSGETRRVNMRTVVTHEPPILRRYRDHYTVSDNVGTDHSLTQFHTPGKQRLANASL
jgi:hypothetical protein